MRRIFLGAALALLAAAPMAAQQKRPTTKGMIEFGPFGRYTWYDQSFNQVEDTKGRNSFGAGARLGYFLSDRVNLEAEGSLNATDITTADGDAVSVGLTNFPFNLGVNYNAPLSNNVSWFLGPRVVYTRYSVADEAADYLEKAYEGSDIGFGGVTGLRLQLSNSLAARLEGTMHVIPSPTGGVVRPGSADPDANTLLGAQLGLGITLGRSCGNVLDSIRIEPRNAEIMVGDTQSYKVVGYRCDGAVIDVMDATFKASGGSMAGATFTGSAAGCFDVEATAMARRKGTDAAKVCVKARPVVLDRCTLSPAERTEYPDHPIQYTVTGTFSDGSSRELTDATLTASGGTVTGRSFMASTPGTYTVTANCGSGKSATARVTIQPLVITLRALFEFGKSRVYQQAEVDSLKWLAGQLKEHPDLKLTIYGHTDWVGTPKYNGALGDRRIKAVMDSLVSYGVDAARVAGFTTMSYGECQPIADNKTDDGRALNRRVELFDTPSAKKYEGNAICRNRP